MSVKVRYLATTLALVALAVGLAWVTAAPAPPRPRPAPSAGRPAPLPAAPTAREILDRAVALGLDPRQRAALETLAGRWERESAALQADVDAAAREFARWMDRRPDGGRAGLAEIRQRSAAVSELGTGLREHRRRHADAAAAILTEAQRTGLARTFPMTVTEAHQ
jgi:hypothetical protein